MSAAPLQNHSTRVLPPEFDRHYPVIVRGKGVWLEDSEGNLYLDAMSGGSMAASLGHGRPDIIKSAQKQAKRLAYVHNERLTNPAQERLARELVGLAPEGFTRARFVTSGSEANETAIRLARAYHVERGDTSRWQIISPAQAYHGPTLQTLALTGRPGLHGPLTPYLPQHLHIPPSTWRQDPTGQAALDALDSALAEAGPETVAAFFCEPISAAALPAYTPPTRFWEGLAERRDRYGFLICFDEVVTGMGRTGSWFAGAVTPLVPDIIAIGKGLGAGYAAIGAVLCRQHVYEAVATGSRRFTLGHTWDGAPLSCAVGLAVIDVLRKEGLVERVHQQGTRLREQLREALMDIDLVRDVRGHGFLLGIEYVNPRGRKSFLPPELRVASRIDEAALEQGLVVLSTQPTRDGYTGDQSLFAPAFTSTEEELGEMIARFAAAIGQIADEVERELYRRPGSPIETDSRRQRDRRGLRALVIQHERASPGGLVLDWLDSIGAETDVLHINEDEREVDPRDYNLIVSLGSELAAHDDSFPWLQREKQLMLAASTSDVPILGLCFGGQLLARVLGGDSFRGQKSEVGWMPVRTIDPDLVSEGPWFQWHFDTFMPPPDSTLIAVTDAGPQAFVAGRNLGLQFHPEVTPEIMKRWVAAYAHELDAEGVNAEDLLKETERLAEGSRKAGLRLLDTFFDRVAQLRTRGPR